MLKRNLFFEQIQLRKLQINFRKKFIIPKDAVFRKKSWRSIFHETPYFLH